MWFRGSRHVQRIRADCDLAARIRSRNSNSGMNSMTTSEEKSPPAVGAYWINEGDYPALLRIFPDGNRMPRTWAEWLKIAEEMESGLKAYGQVVMRARIDPNTFLDWCAAHGTSSGRGIGQKCKKSINEIEAEPGH